MFFTCYNKVEVGTYPSSGHHADNSSGGRMINYIKLYFICVTYGLSFFSFRFVSLRVFLFFSFSFVSFLFSLFCFRFFAFRFFRFFSLLFSLFSFRFFFLSVSFRFFSFFSVSQFTGTLPGGVSFLSVYLRIYRCTAGTSPHCWSFLHFSYGF